MTATIPEPEGLVINQIRDLKDFMKITHTAHEFTYFQRYFCIHTISFRPHNKQIHELDPILWNDCMRRIAMGDPRLNRYENLWPIRVYYECRVRNTLEQANRLASGGRRKRRRNPKAPTKNPDPRPPTNPAPTLRFIMESGHGSSTTSSNSGTLSSNSHTPPTPQAAYPVRTTPRDTSSLQNPKPGGSFRRMYIGRPPPDIRKKRTASSSGPPNPVPIPSQISQSVEEECSDDELGAAPCSDVPWSRSPKNSSNGPPLEMVRVGCLECGRPPPRDLAGHSKSIQATVGDNSEHLRVLFNAGLIGDRHLAMFLEWPPGEQKTFISSLDTSAFIKEVLAHRLISPEDTRSTASECGNGSQGKECGEVRGNDVGQESPPSHCTPPETSLPTPPPPYRGAFRVQQPNQDDEEMLTDPVKPDDMLFRALCLEGPNSRELFDELVALTNILGFEYLSTYHPTKELFEKTVAEICKDKQALELYENNWPVRFILKRLARKCGNKPLDDHLGVKQMHAIQHSTKHPSTSVSPCKATAKNFTINLTALECTPTPWVNYTCPTHSGVDLTRVSDSVMRLLHHQGLAELIPVLATVGIREDTDLVQFCMFSDEEKHNIFEEDGQWLKLNAFQKLALRLELSERKMGSFFVVS